MASNYFKFLFYLKLQKKPQIFQKFEVGQKMFQRFYLLLYFLLAAIDFSLQWYEKQYFVYNGKFRYSINTKQKFIPQQQTNLLYYFFKHFRQISRQKNDFV
eukprot:TRINITY_DN379_c1_g1_i6.p7 TRINITY_DN379_c1_g1~~TRINITY_DN379_c1_g1_i6.p7  ORF type:complete len:101 (-),score=0.04 TRINITY_DN379_c1_g1_i6:578-880(-)